MDKTIADAWCLHAEAGRHRWVFDKAKAKEILGTTDKEVLEKALCALTTFDRSINPNAADLIFRNKAKTSTQKARTVEEALKNGFAYFNSLQETSGAWAGDYGGPHFLLPGLLIVLYITDSMPTDEVQVLMKQYLLNHQLEDGGWGLHIEDSSTMFGTVLNLTALVLLENSTETLPIQKALNWIHQNGGVETVPPWGKMYLALLGLYEWKGLDALLPEIWLLPKKLPVFPGNYWNHARMVYLPMSYLFGTQFRYKGDALIQTFRDKLYTDNYHEVNWKKARRKCCKIDDYYPETKWIVFFNTILNAYNNVASKKLRKKALKEVLERIHGDDVHTNYINLGPVNKVLNMLVVFATEGKSDRFQKHLDRVSDYLWLAEDGMKMNGYNGSQFWDTVFMAHAIMESGTPNSEWIPTLNKIEKFLVSSYIDKNQPNYQRFGRSISKGGWPFSTIEHAWPITDCTAEGLKAIVHLHQKGLLQDNAMLDKLPESVNLLLSYQNKDGGWASYEKTRAPKWLEKLNPSRVFGEIMIDHSYVECTSATIQGLAAFSSLNPTIRSQEIDLAIKKGLRFIESKQEESGLWYGSWAVCYTYGTWFAVEALTSLASLTYDSNTLNPVTKACMALVERQNSDGSWGESYLSSVHKKYISLDKGQVTNTAWALMTLMAANYPNHTVIDKGIRFLVEKQEISGDWPQQQISGTFNHNCMITYINYRNIFPLWAFQRYVKFIS